MRTSCCIALCALFISGTALAQAEPVPLPDEGAGAEAAVLTGAAVGGAIGAAGPVLSFGAGALILTAAINEAGNQNSRDACGTLLGGAIVASMCFACGGLAGPAGAAGACGGAVLVAGNKKVSVGPVLLGATPGLVWGGLSTMAAVSFIVFNEQLGAELALGLAGASVGAGLLSIPIVVLGVWLAMPPPALEESKAASEAELSASLAAVSEPQAMLY